MTVIFQPYSSKVLERILPFRCIFFLKNLNLVLFHLDFLFFLQ